MWTWRTFTTTITWRMMRTRRRIQSMMMMRTLAMRSHDTTTPRLSCDDVMILMLFPYWIIANWKCTCCTFYQGKWNLVMFCLLLRVFLTNRVERRSSFYQFLVSVYWHLAVLWLLPRRIENGSWFLSARTVSKFGLCASHDCFPVANSTVQTQCFS